MPSTSDADQPREPTRDGDSEQRTTALIAIAASVAAIVAAAAALGALFAPAGSARAVAIGCGVLVLMALGLNVWLGKARRSIAISTALLLAVAAASGGAAIAKKAQHTDTSGTPIHKTHLPALTISLAYHQQVPWCTTLNGTGKIPTADSLLIFDREVDSHDQASSDSMYSPDGPVKPSGNGWSLSPIYIGPEKKVRHFYVELTAILVPKRTASFINGIPIPWATSVLPPALETKSAFVLRNGDLTQCG